MLEVWKKTSDHRDPSQITDFLEEVLKSLQIPALLVRGAMSDVVSKEIVAELLAAAPNLQFVDVQDAGHMVAGDSNAIFTSALVDFLKEL